MSYDITQPEDPASLIANNSASDQLDKIDRTTKKSKFDRTFENLTCRPTVEVHNQFEEAFDYANLKLFYPQFGICLPHVIFSTPLSIRFMGYFIRNLWNKESETVTQASEIALNPLFFKDRLETCKTLVHEMMHLGQAEHREIFGKPGENGYHNKSFAQAMIKIGLMPSSTGLEGGAMTGFRMGEYVIPGGPFDTAFSEYLSEGDKFVWSIPLNVSGTGDQAEGINSIHGTNATRDCKRRSKTKYTCPICKLIARAKPAVYLVCGKCSIRMMEDGNGHQQVHPSSNHVSPPVIY